MEELFRSYWWLMFPVGWMMVGAFRGWLADRARRDAVELLKSYAEAGRDPPAALVARLRADSAC